MKNMYWVTNGDCDLEIYGTFEEKEVAEAYAKAIGAVVEEFTSQDAAIKASLASMHVYDVWTFSYTEEIRIHTDSAIRILPLDKWLTTDEPLMQNGHTEYSKPLQQFSSSKQTRNNLQDDVYKWSPKEGISFRSYDNPRHAIGNRLSISIHTMPGVLDAEDWLTKHQTRIQELFRICMHMHTEEKKSLETINQWLSANHPPSFWT